MIYLIRASGAASVPLLFSGPGRAARFLGRRAKMNVAISTADAPAALGPYSQAIRAGNTLYISGQLGLDPTSMKFVDENCVKAQTERALTNLQNVLEAAGGRMRDVVSATVMLADIQDFSAVNEIYAKFFPPIGADQKHPPPARACYAVKTLPKGGLVEISAIAHLQD